VPADNGGAVPSAGDWLPAGQLTPRRPTPTDPVRRRVDYRPAASAGLAVGASSRRPWRRLPATRS
jgi:hypothetical protein